MVLELTLLQENFLDSTFGNGSFRNISDEIKEELKNKSRDNIIGINNFLENFGIDQEKLTEYKDMPIYKSENGFYYYNFEKRLLPIIDSNNRKFDDIKIYSTTPEHAAVYLSVLSEMMGEHNNLVERNRQLNEVYKNDKLAKLDYRRFYEIVRDSFNKSFKECANSYKLHYRIALNNCEEFEYEKEPSPKELKKLLGLAKK